VKKDVTFRSIYNFHSDKSICTFKWWSSFWYLHHVWCLEVSHASASIWTNSDALKKEEVRPSKTLEYLITTLCRISTLKKGKFIKIETFNHYMVKKAIRKTLFNQQLFKRRLLGPNNLRTDTHTTWWTPSKLNCLNPWKIINVLSVIKVDCVLTEATNVSTK
jgi:hypothetical protein